MLAKLKAVVAELEQLEKRAAKYRPKQDGGRIEIAAAEYNRLAEMCGEPAAEDGAVHLTIHDYVSLIDAAIAAVVSRINLE
jgi:hypothetical protein